MEIAGEEILLDFAKYLTNKAESEVKHEAMCLDLSNKSVLK